MLFVLLEHSLGTVGPSETQLQLQAQFSHCSATIHKMMAEACTQRTEDRTRRKCDWTNVLGAAEKAPPGLAGLPGHHRLGV